MHLMTAAMHSSPVSGENSSGLLCANAQMCFECGCDFQRLPVHHGSLATAGRYKILEAPS